MYAPPADSPAAEVALGSDREPNARRCQREEYRRRIDRQPQQNSDSEAARADAEQRSRQQTMRRQLSLVERCGRCR